MLQHFTTGKIGPPVILGFAALLLSGVASAQAPAVQQGNVEVGGFVGGSYGIDKFRVMGGGNISYAATRVVMPYGEFSYFPGIGRKIDVSGTPITFSIPLYDFHAGVHLRVPLKESRVIPYGVFGVGVVHSLARTETANITLLGETQTRQVPVPAVTAPAVNFGAGLRFYLTQRFGLRAEAKAYKATGDLKDIFGKVEGGFFFQLH